MFDQLELRRTDIEHAYILAFAYIFWVKAQTRQPESPVLHYYIHFIGLLVYYVLTTAEKVQNGRCWTLGMGDEIVPCQNLQMTLEFMLAKAWNWKLTFTKRQAWNALTCVQTHG